MGCSSSKLVVPRVTYEVLPDGSVRPRRLYYAEWSSGITDSNLGTASTYLEPIARDCDDGHESPKAGTSDYETLESLGTKGCNLLKHLDKGEKTSEATPCGDKDESETDKDTTTTLVKKESISYQTMTNPRRRTPPKVYLLGSTKETILQEKDKCRVVEMRCSGKN
ncbi:unnamed protein product [Owenia fusiformis]|uniref:Uncharacterized protein n=1 Tax=Owenia fusiformis TaxID=6347 RepID=A0A8J1Y9C8_OWEFU|nr:unnamed protein product [Owenia fusiformis]